ncbi:carnitine dehydratase [Pseudomonas sp. FW305-E2]|uniref:aldehyde dehydrogenase n=1 Tax=Pseudomonas sp. FW305-E2 TaxID=2075558 RepID=UPI000B4FC078|nr:MULTISPECIES: aldehyde dehydrogenase [Pseudomonas]POA82298.1 carnitine dehydratase [Pseudomonas sp. FW305-E2]
MKTYSHWIDGAFQAPASNAWLDTFDPYHGEAWAKIPKGNAIDASAAVAAAKYAMRQGPWASMSATERGKTLRRIGDITLENIERLADLEVKDNGKLLAEMRGAIRNVAEIWYYYAGLADKIEGSVMPMEKAGIMGFTMREPIGVVLALTAWNAPLNFLALKCAPALAAGCSVVIKPSEFSSVSSLEFAALTKKAGLPDGVLNVVTGLGHDIGAPLVEHSDVAMVTFTGSDTTGAKVYAAAAQHMKRVTMELGGKSPNIIFADADLDLAVGGAISGIFGAAGQMCTAGSRLLVQNSIKGRFTDLLLAAARSVKVGDPMDPSTHMGPMSTAPQYQKVLDYIDIALSEGAKCLLGGKPASGPGIKGGQFIEPTVFTDVSNDMRIAQEEVFGPVLSIIGFEDEAEAIEIANTTLYGLAAGVWTGDVGRLFRVSKALDVGTVWGNTYRTYSYMMPFGGMKQSGIGRESGIEAVNEYLETKSLMVSIAETRPENNFVPR